MSENFADLFETSYVPALYTAGQIVPATVIHIEKDYIYLDAGTKSEAYVPIEQFKNEEGELTVEIGDVLDMYLEMPVDGLGETRLDRDKAERIEELKKLKQYLKDETPIKGIVTHAVRAGLNLRVGKIRAFLPGSLIDTRLTNSLDDFVDQTLEVKILKIDSEKGNMIVSRRALVDEMNQAEKIARFAKISIGDKVTGVVKNLTDYGAFIDIGGIDGLLHITDMSWRRVNHPSEITNIGAEIEVQVMNLDQEKSRLSLGLKQLQQDPWDNIEQRLPVGHIVEDAIVSNITDYGAFVAVESTIDGLVHTSELDWTHRNIHPSKILSVGDKVNVKIISLDKQKRRFSLSIKQCVTNPWEEFSNNHKRGDIIKGIIRSKTDFGLFVGLPGGIDGLIHSTDLSWQESDKEEELAKYTKGSEIQSIVLSMDIERERVSLGIKQLNKDMFTSFITENNKGSIVSGKVVKIASKGGSEIELAPQVFGYLRKTEMLGEAVIGDDTESVITNIDKKNRKIYLSVKSKEKIEEKTAYREYQKSNQEGTGNTMWDIVGDQFSDSEQQNFDK